mmetsp:Transcript_3440/g.5844  ORF Transcript_3440/g.5844 Transcript_3440/m.5844 type:complete len:157 (-) Transcript_3440:12-482(-)
MRKLRNKGPRQEGEGVLSNSVVSFDPEQFLTQRKQQLNRFFQPVYEQLSQFPYSLHFYLSLPKFMVRQDLVNSDYHFDLLRKTLRNVSDEDLDTLVYYDTEQALQIVNDLVDNKQAVAHAGKLNKIDNELRSLALRIKKSPNYNLYSKAARSMGQH